MPNYIYADGDTLKNKFGLTTRAALARQETHHVAMRAVELAAGFGPQGSFDGAHLKAIHAYLYQDVYEWAGHTRDEPVTLSDGTVARESSMETPGGREFMIGRFIPLALDQMATNLAPIESWRALTREDFAGKAAAIMADLCTLHPFRAGNEPTLRMFMRQLAEACGHTFDFSVVSREGMKQAEISAYELDDFTVMRRLFLEISDPARIKLLRQGIALLESEGFDWNDYYLITADPGVPTMVTMNRIVGDLFFCKLPLEMVVGWTADLPEPQPEAGVEFAYVPSKGVE